MTSSDETICGKVEVQFFRQMFALVMGLLRRSFGETHSKLRKAFAHRRFAKFAKLKSFMESECNYISDQIRGTLLFEKKCVHRGSAYW